MWEFLVKRLLGSDKPPRRPAVSPAHDTNRIQPVDTHSSGSGGQSTQRRKAPRTLTCPACEKPMRAEKVGPIEIDRCTGCGGIFLDKGELESITRYLELKGDDAPPHHLVYTPHGWE